MEQGTFPISWTTGIIVPIHKQGNLNNVDNYRGITLLSIFSKVFTSIINKRLIFWSEAMNKINEAQGGFRQGYTRVDNMFVLQSVIQRYLNTYNGKIYTMFVDFSKAFDSVQRQRLWALCHTNGISNKMTKLLSSIYDNVKACVRSNNILSETFDVNIGVRQGCVLSPFLFSFFINELATQIIDNCSNGIQLHPDMFHLFLLLFADDIVLISSTVRGLQRQINELEKYCRQSCLTVNMEKTKVIVFKKGGKLAKTEKWYYMGRNVEVVNSYKYLGVYFTRQMKWLSHAKYASLQARKVFISILKNIKTLGDLNLTSFFRIFDTKIIPILLYGAEI